MWTGILLLCHLPRVLQEAQTTSDFVRADCCDPAHHIYTASSITTMLCAICCCTQCMRSVGRELLWLQRSSTLQLSRPMPVALHSFHCCKTQTPACVHSLHDVPAFAWHAVTYASLKALPSARLMVPKTICWLGWCTKERCSSCFWLLCLLLQYYCLPGHCLCWEGKQLRLQR